jgi:anti-sigma factor RsiW
MTCRDGVRVLIDYTEGVLSAPRRRAVETHVGACARCRGFVRSYCETPRILRAATAARMPARLGGRLLRMVAEQSGRGKPVRFDKPMRRKR